MTDAAAAPCYLRALDLAERAVLTVLFAYFAYTFLRDFIDTGRVTSLILVVSESAVTIFVLFRRPTTNLTLRPFDWALAFGGTLLPLLVRPAWGSLLPVGAVIAIMVVGYLVQIAAKFSLRRSFGAVAANRGVKVGGPYRFVRHPMYAGYVITQIGYLIGSPSLRNLAIYALTWCLQLARIMAEERVLRRDPAYLAFAERVRYRLIPGVF